MATKTRLGGVFMKDTDGNLATGTSTTDENVCGLIFDYNGFTGLFSDPTSTFYKNFYGGNVVEIESTDDLEEAGITSDIMYGLPYYHLSTYFSLAGQYKSLYVSFMDSSTDSTFEAIELIQSASDGTIYQIGVWTTQPAAKKNASGEYEFTDLYTNLQTEAEVLGGKIDEINYDGNSPVNIILNAPFVTDFTFDYKELIDATTLDKPKVSHILGQQLSDSVREIQLKLVEALGGEKLVQVGNIGAAMAVLAVAPADVSIAYVSDYNLSGVMQACELGFGDVTYTAGEAAVLYADYEEYNTAKGTSIDAEAFAALSDEERTKVAATSGSFSSDSAFGAMRSIPYTKRNKYLHANGYIFLTPIDGIKNGVFFSSDQTLSTGDYRTIARGRVMHKSRRLVRAALLTKVNAPVSLDSSTGEMSSADITEYENLVSAAISDGMVEPTTGNAQISDYEVSIPSGQNLLTNDELKITYSLVPMGCTSVILVTEGFTGSISE